MTEQGKNIESAIQKLVSELQKVRAQLERIAAIASSTGLDLSVRTVQNLRHIASGDELLEKLDPEGQEASFFEEVLGVDSNMAHQLMQYFWPMEEGLKIEDIPGMTPELKDLIEARLKLSLEEGAE